MKEELQKLIEQYGADAVAKAAAEALNKRVPTINTPVVTDEQLINTMVSGIDGIMNLAAASGADLAQTSDIVTDGLTAFGMSAGESSRFANVMAAASSNANTNVGLHIWSTHRTVRKSTSLRIKRRLKAAAKQYVAGNLTYERYNSTLQSYMGMMKHNDCYRFKMQLLEDVETIINESGVAA